MADDKIVIGIEADLDKLVKDVQKSDRVSTDFAQDFDKGLKKVDNTVDDVGDEFKRLERDIDGVGDELDETYHKTRKLGGAFSGMGKALAVGIGVGAAVKGITMVGDGFRKMIDIGTESIDLFREQQRAVDQLEVSLNATGNAAGFTSEELQQQASYLQTLTNIGDETTLAMFSMQTAFTNVRGDEFLRTTKAAMDMSTALGKDATQSAGLLAKALNDPIKGMAQLERNGVRLTESQKDQVEAFIRNNEVAKAQAVILDEVEGRFGGSAEAAAGAEGNFTQLWNRVGDVQEVFGGLIIKVLDGMAPAFEIMVSALENGIGMLSDFTDYIMESGDALGLNMETLKDWGVTLIEWFTAGETFVVNFGKSMDLVAATNALSLMSMAEDFKFLFTEQIPSWLGWFAEHWSEVFTDIFNFEQTVITNMWKNFEIFFNGLYDWLSGNKSSFEFVGLTEGFESSISELPKILERGKSDLEKALESEINSLSTDIASDYQKRLETNLEFVNDLTTTNTMDAPELNDKSKEVNGSDLIDALKEKNTTEPTVKDPVLAMTDKSEDKTTKEIKEPDVGQTEGLTALNARISDAAANYQTKDLEIASTQANLLEEAVNALDVLGAKDTVVNVFNALTAPNVEPMVVVNDTASDVGEFIGDAAITLSKAISGNADNGQESSIDFVKGFFSPTDEPVALENVSSEDVYGIEPVTPASPNEATVVDNTSEFQTLINDQKKLIASTEKLVRMLPFNGVLG